MGTHMSAYIYMENFNDFPVTVLRVTQCNICMGVRTRSQVVPAPVRVRAAVLPCACMFPYTCLCMRSNMQITEYYRVSHGVVGCYTVLMGVTQCYG